MKPYINTFTLLLITFPVIRSSALGAYDYIAKNVFPTAEIIRQYSGENEVCFYLTDLKKYLRLKDFNKISIKDDVLDKLCEILNVNDIGLIN